MSRDPVHLSMPDDRHIARRTARSGAVAIASNIVQMVVGVGTTLVLVRILEPSDFGVFAIAWIVVLLAATVRDLGISVAIMNAEDLTSERVSRLFWSVQAVNLVVGVLIAATGPLLAYVYAMPQLTLLMFWVSAMSVLAGMAAVYDGLLKRQLRFGVVAARDIGSMIAGAGAAITIGLLGYGYWALAAQQLALSFTGLTICLLTTGWLPGNPVRALSTARQEGKLILHGLRLSASKCLTTLGMSADRLILGALTNERTLGFYQQAYMWSEFPSRQVYQPLISVVISGFSRKQGSSDQAYRAAFRQALLVLYGVSLPMLVYGFYAGELVIPVLLGDKWLEAIPLFELLCLGAIFRLLVQASKWVYLAESRSADQLTWTFIFTPTLIAAAVIGALIGDAYGVAMAMAIAYAAATPVAIWYSTRRSRLKSLDLLLPALRPVIASIVAVFILLAIGRVMNDDLSGLFSLIAGVLVFMLANAVAWILPGKGRHELRECIRHLSPACARVFDRVLTLSRVPVSVL